MMRTLRICAAALLAGAALAACAHAGLNAGGTAAIYWQNGTQAGLVSLNSTSSTPQLVVTVKGINNIRGVDLQLSVMNEGCRRPSPAWDFSSTGCNAGNVTSYPGGRGGTYPNLFTASPAVPGRVTAHEGMLVDSGDCLNPGGQFLLWLSTLGSGGVARTPTTEYGVWALKFDFTASVCAGDLNDPAGPQAVCIVPVLHVPCSDTTEVRTWTVGIVDGNLAYDYLYFNYSFRGLQWCEPPHMLMCTILCDDPVRATTWGGLRKIYR